MTRKSSVESLRVSVSVLGRSRRMTGSRAFLIASCGSCLQGKATESDV